jgi:hypothetical protein
MRRGGGLFLCRNNEKNACDIPFMNIRVLTNDPDSLQSNRNLVIDIFDQLSIETLYNVVHELQSRKDQKSLDQVMHEQSHLGSVVRHLVSSMYPYFRLIKGHKYVFVTCKSLWDTSSWKKQFLLRKLHKAEKEIAYFLSMIFDRGIFFCPNKASWSNIPIEVYDLMQAGTPVPREDLSKANEAAINGRSGSSSYPQATNAGNANVLETAKNEIARRKALRNAARPAKHYSMWPAFQTMDGTPNTYIYSLPRHDHGDIDYVNNASLFKSESSNNWIASVKVGDKSRTSMIHARASADNTTPVGTALQIMNIETPFPKHTKPPVNFRLVPNGSSYTIQHPINGGKCKMTQRSRKGQHQYVLTAKLHAGEDGKERRVYSMDGKAYVKRRTTNGTYRYDRVS